MDKITYEKVNGEVIKTVISRTVIDSESVFNELSVMKENLVAFNFPADNPQNQLLLDEAKLNYQEQVKNLENLTNN